MSERTSYEPGIPCWVDLGAPDIDGAAEFYAALFGWEHRGGGERRADRRLPAGDAAGQAGRRGDAADAGGPATGLEHLRLGRRTPMRPRPRLREAGGSVMAEPMDVLDLGRMAVFADPTGAVFGIWQPGTFVGAELVNEASALTWNELNTRDAARPPRPSTAPSSAGPSKTRSSRGWAPTPTFKAGEGTGRRHAST